MIYRFACPNCGVIQLFRPASDHKTTVCECGAVAARAAGDWCKNLKPPFKPVCLFGRGGKKGKMIYSADEMKRELRGGYEGDWDFTGDRVAVSPDEFDEIMGFDSR